MHAQGVFHNDRAASLALTGQRQAISAHFKLGRRRRCGGITRRHDTRQGHVARLVGEGDVKAFAIVLCRGQDHGKRAIKAHDAGANLHTCRVFHGNGAAHFAFARQRQAIDTHVKVSRRRRCRGVARHNRGRQRDVTRLVRQGDVKQLTIFLRRIEHCAKRAVSVNGAGADLHTQGVFHNDGAARFTFTGQRQAIDTHLKLSRRCRCRGVSRNHRGDCRHVARLIGQGDVEGFAIFLRGIKDGGKRAVRANDTGADLHTRRVFHDDDAARFAFTRQRQAIDTHLELCRRRRCRGVTGNHWRDCRHVARLVRQSDVKQLAIFLRRIEHCAKRAISANGAGADLHTQGIFNDDGATRFAFTGQCQAIDTHFKVRRRRRCCGVTRNHWHDRRHVARLVGQGDVEGFAIFLRGIEDRGKRTVRPNDSRADLHARGVFHGDDTARFAFARQLQAINADFKLSRRCRCRGVARNHWRDCRYVAGLVSQGDVQGFAIGLRSIEGDFETAISAHRPAAYHCARSVFDRHRAADFAFTAQGQAINAHFKLSRRTRSRRVTGYHRGDRRHVACLVGQGNVEGLAIFLRGIEDRSERAVRTNNTGTDLHARRVFHGDHTARFTFTGQFQAIEAHFQLSRRVGCRGITRYYRGRRRHVARLVGQGNAEGLAIFLRRVEGDGKITVSADDTRADLHTQGVFNGHRAARLTFTVQGQAIRADFKLGWGCRCRGVARCHRGRRRHVTGLVSQGDVDGLAIFLRGIEDRGKRAISVNDASTDLRTGGVFHDDGAACFTFTAQGQAIRADRQFSRCQWRGGIAGDNWRHHRHVAGFVCQRDVKGFAIGLCGIEGDGKGAIQRHRSAADHSACGILNGDG